MNLCNICRAEKQHKFCNECKADTPTLFTKELVEKATIRDTLRNLLRSGERVRGKPAREIEQYVGNKDKDVVSEYERIRSRDKTSVVHRLWRRFGNTFKKVHEHLK